MHVQMNRAARPKLFPPLALANDGDRTARRAASSNLSVEELRRIVSDLIG